MLTANRPEMARQAVENFRAQTYANKALFVLDTSATPEITWTNALRGEFTAVGDPSLRGKTIGELRNWAIKGQQMVWGNDILIHWDDDDYSHPSRIAEQVALLQSSGADVVGYYDMLFWDSRAATVRITGADILRGALGIVVSAGEAWLYSTTAPNYALGTSLCYWRKAWERKPFEAISQGEDREFLNGLKCVSVSSSSFPQRMVARIHAGNTSIAYNPAWMRALEKQAGEWKRDPDWDSYCERVFA